MIKVVIFDFDGTIADSLEATVKFYNELAPRYGLKMIKKSEQESLRNLGARELIKKFQVSPWKLLHLIKEMRSKLKDNTQNIPLIKGMDKLFSSLERRKIKVGIVTSNSKENVEIFLKKWGITNVDFIHSENSLFGKGKALNHIIRQQELNKEECIYVGDEVRDIEAAHKAGISIIAVTWGFNLEKRLRQSQPEYLVSSPKEISEIFKF